ncbi:MAG: hypothetical protein J6S31_05710 [Lachnospiraceae bacterium]|nr:hypothetical protein [Lachnospiraceae bacterium]
MTLGPILIITCAAFILLWLVFALIFYIFKGVGMYTISRRRQLSASALAWIPFISMFKLGQIADDAVLKKRGRRTHYVALYPIFLIAGGVLSGVSTFLNLVAIRFSPELVDSIFRGEIDMLQRNAQEAISDPVFYIGLAIAAISYILLAIASVFLNVSLFHIYKSCTGKYIVFFVLSLVFSFLYPIFLFVVRKNDSPIWYPAGPVQKETDYYGTENTY